MHGDESFADAMKSGAGHAHASGSGSGHVQGGAKGNGDDDGFIQTPSKKNKKKGSGIPKPVGAGGS